MQYLQILRWKNLLIILLTEFAIKYGLFDFFFSSLGLSYRMSNELFIIIALSSILIAAGANIHNDIQDIEIDSQGKPERPIPSGKISISTAKNMMIIMNIAAVVLSFASAIIVHHISLAIFQLTIIILLYAYSKTLKCSKIIGNIAVSLSIAAVPILIWIYTIYDTNNQGLMFSYELRWMHISTVFFAGFAFLSNLIREVIKDRHDAQEDSLNNCHTWAAGISIGRFRTLIVLLSAILIIFIALYQWYFPIEPLYRFLFFIPQILIIVLLIPSTFLVKNKAQLSKLSSFIKIIMLSGLMLPLALMFM